MDFTTVNEQKRTYIFAGGNRVSFSDVAEICIRESGTHRLNLKNGRKVIVSRGWLAIEIDGLSVWVF